MTDYSSPLPSRRAQREAREMVAQPTATELPSRRSLRQQQQFLGQTLEPETVAPQTPDRDPWIESSTRIGQSNTAVATLHIEQFPTGEIAGPIDHTGEIILTGPLTVPAMPSDAPPVRSIVADIDVESPGIPRRATEALSIIGRAAPIDENTKIPSVGQGIYAGTATFFGLLVLALVGLALFTDLI